jgi:hemerythrin-like domain-containing protein
MKEVIDILVEDHKIITQKIDELYSLLPLKPEESFTQILQIFSFFNEFTFKGHHQREGQVLYTWMVKQNKNSDTMLMDRINNEHIMLEKLAQNIVQTITNCLSNKPEASAISALAELSFMITKYREHIEREESFIFMIAESLKLSEKEEREMILKMKKTYS